MIPHRNILRLLLYFIAIGLLLVTMLNFLPPKHPENSNHPLWVTVHVNIAIMLTQPQPLPSWLAKVINTPTNKQQRNLLSGERDDSNSIFASSVFLKLVQPSMKSSFF